MSFLEHLFNKKKHNQETGEYQSDDDTFPMTEEEVRGLEQYQDTFFNDQEQQELQDSSEEAEEYEVVELEILPTKIICPDCGGITLEGLEFCDKCGGELL